jgi:transposase
LHHWTDQKIRVHAFYCVLALLLSSLLRRTLAQKGIELSIVKIFETLEGIKEVALINRDARSKTRPIIAYSRLSPLQKRVVDALDLTRFQSP